MKKIIGLVCCVLLNMMYVSLCVAQTSKQEQREDLITVKVTGKEHVVEREKHFDEWYEDSYYLIFTDKETFKLENSFVFGQFRSSDIYGLLQKGKSYKFKVFGVRIPLFSMYRKIIGVYDQDNNPVQMPQINNSKSVYVVKVTGKERVDGQYLIFTNEGTFKIEDSLIFGRFNSSDVYGMMEVGKYYRIKTFGIRSGVLSSYKNIIEVEALD